MKVDIEYIAPTPNWMGGRLIHGAARVRDTGVMYHRLSHSLDWLKKGLLRDISRGEGINESEIIIESCREIGVNK